MNGDYNDPRVRNGQFPAGSRGAPSQYRTTQPNRSNISMNTNPSMIPKKETAYSESKLASSSIKHGSKSVIPSSNVRSTSKVNAPSSKAVAGNSSNLYQARTAYARAVSTGVQDDNSGFRFLASPSPKRQVSTSSKSAPVPATVANPLATYRARKDRERIRVLGKYDILGYIAAGTYGRVYKAKLKETAAIAGGIADGAPGRVCAIKKFKADKEGEITHYTGISQSACREMSLCRELNHKNITKLIEIILEDKSIYMVFDFAEHDLLQIIHYHCHPERRPIPESTVKSVLWQVLNGVSYLHQNWVLHRDLKPANIMLSSDGVVKIGDLGLARLFRDPLQSLWGGDKVVVTIWYRAPELLFGARHYTPAIDLWAVGCIFAELLSLRPIFKGEEAKMDNKRNVPFQRNQVQKVIEVLGTPTVDKWPSLAKYPEYHSLQSMKVYQPNLESWYHATGCSNPKGFELLSSLLEFDPSKRISASDALLHPYFTEEPRVKQNVFEGQTFEYPNRRISNEDNDIKASSFPVTKRAAIALDNSTHARKKQK